MIRPDDGLSAGVTYFQQRIRLSERFIAGCKLFVRYSLKIGLLSDIVEAFEQTGENRWIPFF